MMSVVARRGWTLAVILTLGTITAIAQNFVTPRGEAENVRFEQQENGAIHVIYDLVSTDVRGQFSVRLEVSLDGGATYDSRPLTLSGDAGPGVTPGSARRIVWDSAKDVERVRLDQLRFRVVPTGTPRQVEEAPAPVPPSPEVEAPKKGGSAMKWILPVAAAGGLAAVLAGKGGGSSGPTFTPTPVPTPVPCTFTLSNQGTSFGSGSGFLRITTTTNLTTCAWSASSNASFMTVNGAASFTGTNTVTFDVQANTGSAARTGTVTVAGQTVTVTQAGSTDTATIVSLTPPAGSQVQVSIPANRPNAEATVRVTLGSRNSAFVCVFPVGTNFSICSPIQVTRGTANYRVNFGVTDQQTALPLNTSQLRIFLSDVATFTTSFYSVTENFPYVWIRR